MPCLPFLLPATNTPHVVPLSTALQLYPRAPKPQNACPLSGVYTATHERQHPKRHSLNIQNQTSIWVVLQSRVPFRALFCTGAVLSWGLKKGPHFTELPRSKRFCQPSPAPGFTLSQGSLQKEGHYDFRNGLGLMGFRVWEDPIANPRP